MAPSEEGADVGWAEEPDSSLHTRHRWVARTYRPLAVEVRQARMPCACECWAGTGSRWLRTAKKSWLQHRRPHRRCLRFPLRCWRLRCLTDLLEQLHRGQRSPRLSESGHQVHAGDASHACDGTRVDRACVASTSDGPPPGALERRVALGCESTVWRSRREAPRLGCTAGRWAEQPR